MKLFRYFQQNRKLECQPFPVPAGLYQFVPQELIERPKQGFGIPLGDWLRGPLKDWSEELLEETKLEKEGFFNPEVIRGRWENHLKGRINWEHSLWNVLMFQSWLESQ